MDTEKQTTIKEDTMAGKTIIIKVGRDAVTGRFISVEKALSDPAHSVVETIKRTY